MRSMFDEINSAMDKIEALMLDLQRHADEENEMGDQMGDQWHSATPIDVQEAAESIGVSQSSKPEVAKESNEPRRRANLSPAVEIGAGPRIAETELNPAHLLSMRIVTYDGTDQRSRPYDMLRTQILRSMGHGGLKILGVTSPRPGCGKTLTAINLAFSIARQPNQSVVLVDMDLQKPQIASCLGLKSVSGGVLDLLKQRTTLQSVATPVRAGTQRIVVLPTAATKELSELMSSPAMYDLLHEIRKSYQSHIVILDLPPMLPSDDVIAILPQIDCVLLVMAVGHSKISEFEECQMHLHSTQLVRVVVNKATDSKSNYYYRY